MTQKKEKKALTLGGAVACTQRNERKVNEMLKNHNTINFYKI